MEFVKEIMVTGAEQRNRSNGEGSYILVHVLGDMGTTFSCMYKGDPNKIMSIEKMKVHKVNFQVSVGKYTQLNILDIDTIK